MSKPDNPTGPPNWGSPLLAFALIVEGVDIMGHTRIKRKATNENELLGAAAEAAQFMQRGNKSFSIRFSAE